MGKKPRHTHAHMIPVHTQGTDTLATLVEGIRFILCSNPSYLEAWALDKPRTHPGARGRKDFRELLEIREENMQAAHRRYVWWWRCGALCMCCNKRTHRAPTTHQGA